MGDELFLRSRCSGGTGCHCAGMEHFYVPESTDRALPTSSRGRRVSNQGGGGPNDSLHSARSVVRPALARIGGAPQSCTATLLASVFDQVSDAPADGRQVRSRRVRRSARGQPAGQGTETETEAAGDTSGLPDLSYLAYSSDEEFEEFMKKPRTDYTYSRSLSYTAVSPERVGPPSMSRLTLHSPGHGAGDSPILGSRAVGGARGEERTVGGAGRTAGGRRSAGGLEMASPALAGGGEQGVYESTTTRVYSYRREIISRVTSNDPLSNVSVAAPQSFAYSSSSSEVPSVPPSPSSARLAQQPGRGHESSALHPSSPVGTQSSAESSRPTPSSEDTLLDLDLSGGAHGLSVGLDADSQDEEWLSTDGVSKLGSDRCSTPYKTHPGWSVRRGARLAFSPLLRLWLLLVAVWHHLWTTARPLFLARVAGKHAVSGVDTVDSSVFPTKTAAATLAGTAEPTSASLKATAAASEANKAAAASSAAAEAGRAREERQGSRPPSRSRSRHRYQLRPRLTPQRDGPPSEWSAGVTEGGSAGGASGSSGLSGGLNGGTDGLSGGQSGAWSDLSGRVGHSFRPAVSTTALAAASGALGGGEPGRLVTALAWLAAVLWFINPLRWLAAAGRAAISRARTAAEVLDLPRGAATVAEALNPVPWMRMMQQKLSSSSGKRESRPGWLRSFGTLLWGPVGTVATSSTTAQSGSVLPGSGTRAELWRRSGSILGGARSSGSRSYAGAGSHIGAGSHSGAGSYTGAGSQAGARSQVGSNGGSLVGGQWIGETRGAEVATSEPQGSRRRCGCLPLVGAALLLLLLTLLLLPIMGWLGHGEGGSPSDHALLPAEWWLVADMDSAKLHLTRGLSSVSGGLSSLFGGLATVLSSLATGLAGGLFSLAEEVAGGLSFLAGGVSSLAGGVFSLGVYTLAAVQAAAAQLWCVAGSAVSVLWAPLVSGPVTPLTPASITDSTPESASAAVPASSPDPASAPGPAVPAAGRFDVPVDGPAGTPVDVRPAVPAAPAPDPRLSAVLLQLDDLKSRVDLLQSEYRSCRAVAGRPPSAAAVRAALGLPPDSPSPATTDRLAAAELRLQERLETELAALRALLDQPPGSDSSEGRGGGTEGGLAAVVARLADLEAALPAAEQRLRRRDAAERAAGARLDSIAAEMERLREDITDLHRSLAAAQQGLKQAGTCCNKTGPDWGSLLGDQIGRLESQLEDRMQLYTATIRKDLTSEVSSLAGAAAGGGGGGGGGGVSREEALHIAQRELALYDADKTGKFDFALESAGGSIVSTKCTEAYTVRSARLTVLGVPLWYPANNPRSIIQPHMQPGECFAFHGEGQFVVSLSRPVRPTEFVIEHIARGLTPGGRIDSAPRHCSVLGVGEDGEPSTTLAIFEYSASGPPLQRFAAAPTDRAVSAVELRVSSNWGHPEYTCLYRFRVHGQPETGAEAKGEAEEGGKR